MNTMIFIILGIIVIAVIIVAMYNRLVKLVNQAKEAWSDIDVQLKRRYDLIPNLINTVKGYAQHEKETLDRVISARNIAMGAQSLADKEKAELGLAGALKSIFALAEAYPDLKANQNFLALQSELSDTENKIQASRRFYNGTVRDLNTSIESFPSNVIAKMFSFGKMEFFELEEEMAKNPVEVKF